MGQILTKALEWVFFVFVTENQIYNKNALFEVYDINLAENFNYRFHTREYLDI